MLGCARERDESTSHASALLPEAIDRTHVFDLRFEVLYEAIGALWFQPPAVRTVLDPGQLGSRAPGEPVQRPATDQCISGEADDDPLPFLTQLQCTL